MRKVSLLLVTILLLAGCAKKSNIQTVSTKSFTNSVGMEMIKLSTGYYVSKYETRQKEFLLIMGNNPSKYQADENPVEQVTGKEALEFCQKLTAHEKAKGTLPDGYVYSLPSYAQWIEYVADASLERSVTPGGYGKGKPKSPLPVGSGEVNRLGIYDLRGNIAEYSRDLSHRKTQFIFGSSWVTTMEDYLIVTNKSYFMKHEDKSDEIGFRCVLIKK